MMICLRKNRTTWNFFYSVLVSLALLCTPVTVFSSQEISEDQAFQAAVALFNQMHWEQAQKALKHFQKQFPKSRWKFAVQLRLADLEKDPAQAVAAYRSVLAGSAAGEWQADARWGLALSLFILGDYTQAAGLLEKMNAADGMRHAQANYLAGLAYLVLKNYTVAGQRFQMVLDHYKGTQWAQLALLGLGESELSAGNSATAVNAFDRYLREVPEGDATDRVLMQKAKAMAAQGRREESSRLLHELVTRYSESFEAEKARGKLTSNQHKYTIQVGAFSKEEYAEKLVKRLRGKGFNAYVLKAKHGAEIFNQVRIGSYTTREFSEKMAAKLEKSEQLPTIILLYVKPERME
ncbi:tetratricopeptide repeat protein [bacterium]|nr:tetratricopeptide repeat protein [bacterium]